jgi:hypothetical protein
MKFQQQPHTLLMIRPKRFGHNAETAYSNAFQSDGNDSPDTALLEFEKMVDLLKSHEVSVEVFDDTIEPAKPDAIFPNNWISFHEDGKVIVYPMLATNRRLERRNDIIESLTGQFSINSIEDLSSEENHDVFLEGTGSIVFDHVNAIAYACLSPRTNETLFYKLCKIIRYKPILFNALDEQGKPIYHTNVMMSVGEKFAVVCLDAIQNDADQEIVLDSLGSTGHKIISISYDQMRSFAGNILEVKSSANENLVLISETALKSLLPGQVNAITQHADLLSVAIPTIEKIGGGGVRCMVAGIHLPPLK